MILIMEIHPQGAYFVMVREKYTTYIYTVLWKNNVWQLVLGAFDLNQVTFESSHSFWSWWLLLRKTFPKGLRKAFDSLVFIVGWHLWKERNSRTFDTRLSSPREVFFTITEEA